MSKRRRRILLGVSGVKPLNKIVSGCELDIDATVYDSYTGVGENVLNIEPNPASGSAQSAHDMYLGASATTDGDEPTFNGIAGDAAAYFSFDGGDQLLAQSAMNNFLGSLHKTTGGSDFTFLFTLYYISATQALINTKNTNGINQGVDLYSLSHTNKLYMSQGNGSTNPAAVSTNTFNASAWNFAAVAHKHGTNETTFWLNDATGETVSHAFGTTTTDASGAGLSFGAYANGTFNLANGSRMKSLACFNKVLTDEEMDLVKAQYMVRHNQSYI